jgi:formiminotetrahydrofolate cyclodeaminase
MNVRINLPSIANRELAAALEDRCGAALEKMRG